MTLDTWFNHKIPEELKPFGLELETSAIAAIRGGNTALPFLNHPSLRVTHKQDQEPVTEADLASNEVILEILKKNFPQDEIRSEETPSTLSLFPPSRLWLVDPLDGTKSFLAKTGEFSSLVGFAKEGQAFLGSIFIPSNQTLLMGISSLGTWKVENPLGQSKIQKVLIPPHPPQPPRFVRSRSSKHPKLLQLESHLKNFATLFSGSVGIKCFLIALGKAELYVHPNSQLKEWDTCASEVVVQGAGGRVTDCLGQTLIYGKEDPLQRNGIFAGEKTIWDQNQKLVAQIISDG